MGFGNLEQLLDVYQKLDKKLAYINLLYSKLDAYRWIPPGIEYFSSLLNERQIGHNLYTDNFGHDFTNSEII